MITFLALSFSKAGTRTASSVEWCRWINDPRDWQYWKKLVASAGVVI